MDTKTKMGIGVAVVIVIIVLTLIIVYVIIPSTKSSSILLSSTSTNSTLSPTLYNSTLHNSTLSSTSTNSTSYVLKDIFNTTIDPMYNSKIFTELYGNGLSRNELYNRFVYVLNMFFKDDIGSTSTVENLPINDNNIEMIKIISDNFISSYIAFDIYNIIAQKIAINTNNLVRIYLENSERYIKYTQQLSSSLISFITDYMTDKKIPNLYNITINEYIGEITKLLESQNKDDFMSMYTAENIMIAYGLLKLAYKECWTDLTYKPYTIIYNELLTDDMLRKVDSSSINPRILLTMFVVFYGGNIPKQSSKSAYIAVFNPILEKLFNSDNNIYISSNSGNSSSVSIDIDMSIRNFMYYF